MCTMHMCIWCACVRMHMCACARPPPAARPPVSHFTPHFTGERPPQRLRPRYVHVYMCTYAYACTCRRAASTSGSTLGQHQQGGAYLLTYILTYILTPPAAPPSGSTSKAEQSKAEQSMRGFDPAAHQRDRLAHLEVMKRMGPKVCACICMGAWVHVAIG